jgi:hypothetical protein
MIVLVIAHVDALPYRSNQSAGNRQNDYIPAISINQTCAAHAPDEATAPALPAPCGLSRPILPPPSSEPWRAAVRMLARTPEVFDSG